MFMDLSHISISAVLREWALMIFPGFIKFLRYFGFISWAAQMSLLSCIAVIGYVFCVCWCNRGEWGRWIGTVRYQNSFAILKWCRRGVSCITSSRILIPSSKLLLLCQQWWPAAGVRVSISLTFVMCSNSHVWRICFTFAWIIYTQKNAFYSGLPQNYLWW